MVISQQLPDERAGGQTRNRVRVALIAIGIAFLLFAILGRYIVMPGYLESLESGASQGGAVPAEVETWKVVRYIVWGYSFKFGIFLIAVGALLRTDIEGRRLALLIAGGLLYLAFAFMPIPGPSLLFGIGGGLMTIFMVVIILRLPRARDQGDTSSATGIDLRFVGYFFFAMATYTLCALVGTKGFVLEPEKMIQYGLQTEAASYAAHVLIELVLGWFFMMLGYLTSRTNTSTDV